MAQSNKIFLFLFAFWMFLSAFFACSVRDRSNIFDPKSGIDTLNMRLYLRSADSVVTLQWYNTYDVHIQGYHLYRRAQGETNFSTLATLPPDRDIFADSTVQYDRSYAYYLTLIGASGESPPTPILQTTPGPGKIWLLDRWNEYILKFSYDLRFALQTHYAIWIPQALAMDRAHHMGVLTYPAYHYAELFDLDTGELYGEVTAIRYPYACAYEPLSQTFWLTDSSGALYRFSRDRTDAPQVLDNRLGKPLALVFDEHGSAFVLDAASDQIIVYNTQGQRTLSIANYKGQRFNRLIDLKATPDKRFIYFIDEQTQGNALYRFSTLTDSLSLVCTLQGMEIVRPSPLDQTLFVAINLDEQAKILQLSAQGTRLNSWQGFKYITDFAINPVNGNLVIADKVLHQLVHLYPDGRILGQFNKAPYPYKVYIE